MTPGRIPSLPLIIALNLLPLAGLLWWGWTPFSVFYLFWIETLIVAFFNFLKIIICQGDEYDISLEKGNSKFGSIHMHYGSHIGKAFRYLGVRIFIFFFYLLFIVTFIGVINSGSEERLTNFQMLLFLNRSFNFALLGLVIGQALQFIFDFILNDEYLHTHPGDFASIFDGRQVVVHVAVVLGGVLGGFVGKQTNGEIWVSMVVVGIFCVAKTIFEIIKYKGTKNIFTERKTA
jgi:hypothetical protein